MKSVWITQHNTSVRRAPETVARMLNFMQPLQPIGKRGSQKPHLSVERNCT